MATLSTLIKKIRKCELCNSPLPMRANPVLQARLNAKILISGQALGIRVRESGIPFNDPSGDRLRQWMNVD